MPLLVAKRHEKRVRQRQVVGKFSGGLTMFKNPGRGALSSSLILNELAG